MSVLEFHAELAALKMGPTQSGFAKGTEEQRNHHPDV